MDLRIKSYEEYEAKYAQSVENPEKFWSDIAKKFTWKKEWETTLEWNFTEPSIEWFKEGQLNITENLLDRHLPTRGDQIAFHWEAN
ncbi:MAG: acetyl-CoA synthetase, partial [Crocinitomicaceae bacterium]